MTGRRAFALGFGLATLFLAGTCLASCGATYKNTAKLETNWLGQVSEVDGGSSSPSNHGGFGGIGDILDTLWSFAWLIGLFIVLLLLLAWRFPAVRGFLTAKRLREARRAAKALN